MAPTPELIASLSSQLKNFEVKTSLNRKQASAVAKTLSALRESEENLRGARKTRLTKRRTLLGNIYAVHGVDAFFLCVIGISATTLGELDAEFLMAFSKWWSQATRPEHFTNLVQHLQEENWDVLPTKGHTRNRKRQHEEAFQDDSDNSDDNDVNDDKSNKDGDQSDPVDGPLDGLVYKLKPMDVIRIIVNGGSDIFLTMPHNHKVTPFVSFTCSSRRARELVTKRQNVM